MQMPILDSDLPAVMLASDFERIRDSGASTQWHLGNYVCCQPTTSNGWQCMVARLVVQARFGETVRYRDGNALNLRPSNLKIERSPRQRLLNEGDTYRVRKGQPGPSSCRNFA